MEENDMRKRKVHTKRRLDKVIISWQELVDNYQTFAADIECGIKQMSTC